MDEQPVFKDHCSFKCNKAYLSMPWNLCEIKLFKRGTDWILSAQRKTTNRPYELNLTKSPNLIKATFHGGGSCRLSLDFEHITTSAHIRFTEKKAQEELHQKLLSIIENNSTSTSVKPVNSYQKQCWEGKSASHKTLAHTDKVTPVKHEPANTQETPSRLSSSQAGIDLLHNMDDHNYHEKENVNKGMDHSERDMKTPTNEGKQFLKKSLAKSASCLSSKNFYSANNKANTVPRSYGLTSRKPGLLPDPEKSRHKLADLSNSNNSVKYSWNRPKPSRSPTVQTPLQGFSNLGNTCYMNAILQSLFKLEPFVRNLADLSHDARFMMSEEQREKQLFICLGRLLNMQMMQQYVSFEKKREVLSQIKRVISNCAKGFSGYGQHDAHEFLSQVLDQIKEEAIELMKNNPPHKSEKSESNSRGAVLSDTIESEEEILHRKNPITANFEFDVLHSITCNECGKCVEKVEKFNDLSVDMPRKRSLFTDRSLQDAVDQFFRQEKIEYKCEQCGCKEATVEHKFLRLPRILVLHLKRYQYQSKSYAKAGQNIDIPKYLTLQSQCYEETPPPSPSPSPYRPINDVIKPKFQLASSSTPVASTKSDKKESKWNRYISEESSNVSVPKVGGDSVQKQPAPTPSEDGDDEASLAVPTFHAHNEPEEEPIKTDQDLLQETIERSKSETGSTVNYNELVMEDMSEEDQFNLALQRSMQEVPSDLVSGGSTGSYTVPEPMEQCEANELCSSPGFYISSVVSDTNMNSNVCKNNNVESACWPSAIVSSVDGTWDTDVEQESTDPHDGADSGTEGEQVQEPPAKKLRSMLEAGKDSVLGSSPREKISTVTNTKLQSLLTQRSEEKVVLEHPRPGELIDLECREEQTVPEVEAKGDPNLDLPIDDKENKTPPKETETPSLSENHMTEEEQRKQEDEEIQRAIQLSLADQEQLQIQRAEELSLDFTDDEEPLSDDLLLAVEEEERKEIDERLRKNADTGDLPYSYQLMSVVSHIGRSSTVGHYISDIYDVEKKCWTSCDDSEISPISESTVRSNRQKSGYIFFYLHRDLVEELENYFKETSFNSTTNLKTTPLGSRKKDERPLSR